MASATRIIGLARLHKKLQRMPELAKAQIKAAMETSANEIVDMMKSLVPKGDTKALHDSIGWTYGKAPKGSTIVATATASMGGELTITIYAGGGDAFYAIFQEFGTRNMQANPFFLVSYRANKKRATSRIRRAVNKAAKEAAAGSS